MSIANFCDLLQTDEARVRCDPVSARPVYHLGIGKELRDVRERKHWSAKQVCQFASSKGFPQVTPQSLRGLETGQTQYPDADVIRGVAAVFDLRYEQLAWRYITANYGLRPEFSLPDVEPKLDPAISAEAWRVEGLPPALRSAVIDTLRTLLAALDIARKREGSDGDGSGNPPTPHTKPAPKKRR
jgi:transcriptional regulator with XRE-family HTH domain